MKLLNNIRLIIKRELGIWRKRPIYLIGSIVPIVFSTIFFVTFFKDGMPSDLPIGIVDYDNSWLTREFIRNLDATQIGEVRKYDSFKEAREDMQKGRITSVCVLPPNMYADILARRQPTFTFYINSLYFVGGALAYKDILTMINLASGAIQREFLRAKGVNEHAIKGILRPIDIDTHQIGNPTTDYGIYLINGLLPGILEMTVILILIYSLGAELKYGTSIDLLKLAGHKIGTAIIGKTLLYTIYFCTLGWGMMGLMFLWLKFPLAGSFWWMMLDVTLLVLASEAIAIIIISLLPICRFALSVGALYSVIGFSMAGFSLPVESLIPEIRGFAEIFPLRHYYKFFVQEGIFANGYTGVFPEIIHLLIFLLIPFFVLPRLERAYIRQNYPKN